MSILKKLKIAKIVKNNAVTFFKPNSRSKKWFLEVEISDPAEIELMRKYLTEK